MLGLSNLRLGIYAAIAVVAGLAYWRYSYVVSALDEAEAKAKNLQESLSIERENTRKEHESAQRYAARLAISRGPRSPPPRLMCKLPASKDAASPAPGRTDVAAAPDDSGVSADVDIGPRLDVSFHACEENLIKLEELQRWIRGRSE